MLARHSTDSTLPTGTLPQLNRQTLAATCAINEADMKIIGLRTKNYRTLESLDLSFPTFYTAICGKNDSGKTNIIKALQAIMGEEGPFSQTKKSVLQ